jgi:hypothetical protein
VEALHKIYNATGLVDELRGIKAAGAASGK